MTGIIARADWGAQYADGFGDRTVGGLDKWLHHTVTAAPAVDAPLAEDVAAMHVLEGDGETRFGGGISYSFVIPPSGRIFEGVSVGRIGAHTYARNRTSVGIALVGNYNDLEVSPAQATALVWLLQEGVAQGWWALPTLTGGHRDVYPTACPGSNGYAAIPEINATASNGVASPVSNPVPVPTPAPTEPTGLVVDGIFGPASKAALQRALHVPADGIFGPISTRSLQVHVGAGVDGVWGPQTTRQIQRHLGVTVDGIAGPQTYSALQARLNAGTF